MWKSFLLLTATTVTWSCASNGPDRIPDDRFDYNQSIGESASEQMLLNIVRLHYREVPVFLAVNSVLTQYVYTIGGNAGGTVGTLSDQPANSLAAGASARYIERPTITYSPLSGLEFAEQMLRPLPSPLLFSLTQSGWPADDLLLMGIDRINDAVNVSFDPDVSASQDEVKRFRAVIDGVVALGRSQAIEMQTVIEDDIEFRYLVFSDFGDSRIRSQIDTFKDLVGLDRNIERFLVIHERLSRRADQITLRNRSLLTLMGFLARGVEPPEEHLESGRATMKTTGQFVDVPLRVRSSSSKPCRTPRRCSISRRSASTSRSWTSSSASFAARTGSSW